MPGEIGFAAVLLVAMVFISSCPSTSGPTTYERIVIETYPWKKGVAALDTTLRLYDSTGTELAFNEDIDAGNVASRIDYTGGLESGTYYIKIDSEKVPNGGPYVIRAISLKLGEALPDYDTYAYPGAFVYEPYPDGDDDGSGNMLIPEDLSLGTLNYLNRDLNLNPVPPPNDPGDVDWCVLELP